VDGLHPRQRMHPARPPLGEDPLALLGYRNLYLVTDAGILDLLGEIPGVGGLEHLKARSVSLRVADFDVPVIGLEDLVLAKRAVARPKDLRVARELERVLARKAKT